MIKSSRFDQNGFWFKIKILELKIIINVTVIKPSLARRVNPDPVDPVAGPVRV
jgi:hypothetical protein